MNILINDTTKADIFSSLFQHIKLFTEQVNITFNKDKLYLQTMDSSRVSIFEMHFFKNYPPPLGTIKYRPEDQFEIFMILKSLRM